MSRLLLDSNVFLWWSMRRPILPERVTEAIADADEAFVSVVSPWELEMKRALGKLELPHGLWEGLEGDGFQLVGIELDDALAAARLPLHHRDPFDRILVAQAKARGLTLVTRDAALASYGVPILAA
jgi:PIN domain nuclease of toxin-antitoxin system